MYGDKVAGSILWGMVVLRQDIGNFGRTARHEMPFAVRFSLAEGCGYLAKGLNRMTRGCEYLAKGFSQSFRGNDFGFSRPFRTFVPNILP